MNYEPGTITNRHSLASSFRDYLKGVSIARSSINNQLIGFLNQVHGDILDIGGFCDLQPYVKSGKHLITDLVDAPQNTFTADARHLPFADGSIGGVLCLSVLEHSQEPWRIIAEIARCIRPSGMAFISVPWMFEAHMEPHDYFRFSNSVIRELTTANSLSIEHMEPANGYFGALAHLLQKRIAARILFGSTCWVLENLFVDKSDYRWASQINCFLRKTPANDTSGENTEVWPDSLRCPRCTRIGGGRLKWNTDNVVCVNCNAVYALVDNERVKFVDEKVLP